MEIRLHTLMFNNCTQHSVLYLYNYKRTCLCMCENARNSAMHNSNADQVIVVATATRYGLYGSVFETREFEIFPRRFRPAPRPTQSHAQCSPGVFQEGKAVGAWSWPPTAIYSRGYRKCSRLPAEIVSSNPAGSMDVSLVSVVYCQRSLRRADHSSRVVLPSGVSLSVIAKSRKWGGHGPIRAVAPWKNIRGKQKRC